MKQRDELILHICGQAGDGAISASEIFTRAAALMGYHVMNADLSPSEIRGFGQTIGYSRLSRKPIHTHGDKANCLIALHDRHAIAEIPALAEDGVIIFDNKPPDFVEEDCAIAGFIEPGMVGYGAPLRDLSCLAAQSGRARNMVALGLLARIFGLAPAAFEQAITARYAHQAEEIKQGNQAAFQRGYRYAAEKLIKRDPIDFQQESRPRAVDSIILSGHEAIARACLAAQIQLYAASPISPATRLLELLSRSLPATGGTVVQTEDPIAAIGHVIGAGFAGKRAITATSGPGLCLMTEFINLAVMAEIPAVIINSQRGGPATGLPNVAEQSDLNLAIFGGSGDSPRVVLAPTNVCECYELTITALEIAERFQTPVIMLIDAALANRIEAIQASQLRSGRFGHYSQELLAAESDQEFQRYRLTPSGISPRALPGTANGIHAITSLEHDERGMPSNLPAMHQAMTAKRFRKMTSLLNEWPENGTTGDDGLVDIGLISWGSSSGAIEEVMEILRRQGHTSAIFCPRLLWPLPRQELINLSKRAIRLIVVEMNHSGQLANLVEQTVKRETQRICLVAGRPLVASDILAQIGGMLA